MARNIFVVGLDPFHRAQLEALHDADRYRFHGLLDRDEVRRNDGFPVAEAVHQAQARLRAFRGRVDAVVGFWDFPVSTMLPLLRQPLGLPGPTLESVLRCEHKYWSRLVQSAAVPEAVPPFRLVDPFDDRVLRVPPLPYPFWIKPVKSAVSHLGFRVGNRRDLNASIREIRSRIGRYGHPFNYILKQARLPAEVAVADGHHCIAEGIISRGPQVTLEGYVYRGEVTVYGVVDSVRERSHRSVFARYQYPSRLPQAVQERMAVVAARFLRRAGYDGAPFNAEFFWDRAADRVWLLEVNTRISKSHAPLFRMVDGDYHHGVMVSLGLGERPHPPHRAGEFRCAAKFMVRRFRDGRVRRAPGPADIARVQAAFPEAQVQVHVHPGMRLSELCDQDSYSYELLVLFLGGHSTRDLLQRYRRCLALLPVELGAATGPGELRCAP